MKKSSLSVSVVLPVYNEEKYVERCLESLAGQTLALLEIIVVDDESKDNSKLKISAFAKASADKQNLKLFSQKHQGPGAARNLGAKKAKGEILIFVDADMYLAKRYVEKLIKPIVTGKGMATFTKEEYVANPENIWSQCWSINNYLPINKRIPDDMPDKAWTFRAIKKSIFLKAGGYSNYGYGEDRSVLEKIGKPLAMAAPGAISYHYNPSSMREIFESARWLGRGEWYKNKMLKGLLTHAFLNSLKNGLLKVIKSNNPVFVIFKLIYDFGVSLGILERKILGIYVK